MEGVELPPGSPAAATTTTMETRRRWWPFNEELAALVLGPLFLDPEAAATAFRWREIIALLVDLPREIGELECKKERFVTLWFYNADQEVRREK